MQHAAASVVEESTAAQVVRRRTFAIISHPDAGKTTLTEKLLLYAGAIDLAGAVRHKAQQRHARSDWMAMEQKRGRSSQLRGLMSKNKGTKPPAPVPAGPKCPFCGRRITVRRLDDRLYHCDHCQKMFQT